MTPQERADALVERVGVVMSLDNIKSPADATWEDLARIVVPIVLKAAADACDARRTERIDCGENTEFVGAEMCATDLRDLAALCGAASPKPGAP